MKGSLFCTRSRPLGEPRWAACGVASCRSQRLGFDNEGLGRWGLFWSRPVGLPLRFRFLRAGRLKKVKVANEPKFIQAGVEIFETQSQNEPISHGGVVSLCFFA